MCLEPPANVAVGPIPIEQASAIGLALVPGELNAAGEAVDLPLGKVREEELVHEGLFGVALHHHD